MARLAVFLTLVLGSCVVTVTRAGPAATKGRIPQPIHPGEPCPVKKLPCVPVYTEEASNRLAELGDFSQHAVISSLPLEERVAPAKSRRKTSCRNGLCRRSHIERLTVLRTHHRAKTQRLSETHHPAQHL